MSHFDYQPSYRRNLPHLQPPGATFFVTFRLAGSLPQNVVRQWNRDADEWQRIVAYVLNNPVKAGYVERCQDWEMELSSSVKQTVSLLSLGCHST